jgi:hypothetical protein
MHRLKYAQAGMAELADAWDLGYYPDTLCRFARSCKYLQSHQLHHCAYPCIQALLGGYSLQFPLHLAAPWRIKPKTRRADAPNAGSQIPLSAPFAARTRSGCKVPNAKAARSAIGCLTVLKAGGLVRLARSDAEWPPSPAITGGRLVIERRTG